MIDWEARALKAEAELQRLEKQEPVGFVESAVRGAGGFHACLRQGVFVPAGANLYAAAGASPVQPIGINGLTEAETSASMSVMGLSKPKVAPPSQMPAGYVLVPVEPTQAMCTAGLSSVFEHGKREIQKHYKAMIAAAPDTSQKEEM